MFYLLMFVVLLLLIYKIIGDGIGERVCEVGYVCSNVCMYSSYCC